MTWISGSLCVLSLAGWIVGTVQASEALSSPTMSAFKPALIVVDFQEDFCPPNGSLAIGEARSIAPVVNDILDLSFPLIVATKDFHPLNHVSFAVNHPEPNNIPFVSFATIHNPYNESEIDVSRLWPNHCVQETPGSEIIPEIKMDRVHKVVLKGTDPRVETYSAFGAPFQHPPVPEATSDLGQILEDANITHIFVVGLALDYCVKSTAIEASQRGYKTVVIKEATKAVDPSDAGAGQAVRDLAAAGVPIVSIDGDELKKVKDLLL